MKDSNEDFEEDDGYDDYDNAQNFDSQYKHYFKFDPQAWDAWSKFFKDAVDPYPNVWYIYGHTHKSFPVNSYFSNTGSDTPFQYLGNNYDGVKVWKKKYFVIDPIQIFYIKHLEQHAVHFMKQPHYYKGLFDILN
jgi:hypothetical protein